MYKLKNTILLLTALALFMPTGAAAENYGTWLPGSTKSKLGFPVGTVANMLAVTSPAAGYVYEVTDGATTSDCGTGAGSEKVTCKYNGAAWVSISAGAVADDTAYNATTWDANMDAATKNAIRDKIETLAGGHDAVTIAVDADEILSLSAQAIGLDTQVANQVFAGPTSGTAADPDFRALVVGDIPDLSGTYLTAETSHADVLVDGDFGTSGLMKTNGAGTYSIITDNSTNWNTAYGWGDQSNHTATAITDGLIIEADLNADEVPVDNDILTFDTTGANFSWQTPTELGLVTSGGAFHDGFSDFVANEHIDWTGAGTGTIHTDNYVENATHTGDVSGSGALTIGADKILESHLKAVDAAADEECLTYESTTGDFEWQACGGGAGDFLANGTVPMTAELYADALGIEFEPGDAITTCASFAATGGGIFYDDSEGKFKKCEDNSLTDLDTTGGSPAFSTLSGGTNTTAAMVVGTGASLAATGSGTIVATSTSGNAATVTGAILTTALTVNTGTVTISGAADNTSAMTLGSSVHFLSGSNTGDQTSVTGNAGTATALAANGANAAAGNAILGVDASGAAEGAFDVWTEAENTAAAYISAETNDLETVATNVATNEIFVGTGAGTGAYIGISACAADEKIEYTDAAPNTFTCEAIGGLVNADLTGTAGITVANLAMTAGRSLSYSTNDLVADAELYTDTLGFVIETPTDADSFVFWKAPMAITITDIDCITGAATSAVIDVQECTSTGTTCVTVDAAITCDADGAADDGALSNGAIDAGDWMLIDVGTVTGTVGHVAITITYTKND